MSTKIKLTPAQIALARGDEEIPGDPSVAAVNAGDPVDPPEEPEAETDPEPENELPEAGDDDIPDEEPEEGEAAEETEEEPDESSKAGESTVPEWVDDDAKELATSYGLREEDLAQFGSREEFDRFGRLTDRRLAEQARFQQYQQQAPRNQEQDEGAGDAAAAKAGTNAANDILSSDLVGELIDPQKYIDENYDEETVGMAKTVRGLQEAVQKLAPMAQSAEQLRQAEEQRQQQEAAMEFHKVIDETDPQLFGKALGEDGVQQLSPAHDANRRAVWDAMTTIHRGIMDHAQRTGQEPVIPPTKTLVKRAVSMALGDEAARPAQQQPSQQQARSKPSREAVERQSRRRRPVSGGGRRAGAAGASSGSSQQADPDDPSSILKIPEIANFWKKAQRQNGVV